VDGDEDQLRQALLNVIGNALVHTPAGTTVTLRAVAGRDRVVLQVADDGPGMPTDVAARITERFYRADPSRSRHRGGSGLGLSIADAIVRAHSGRLTVTSKPGQGTTATIDLPRSSLHGRR
jgi:two-component system OmpR family sensor kinase